MKIASYLVGGTSTFGAVVDDGVIDLPQRLGERFGSLRQLLAGNAIDLERAAIAGVKPDRALAAVRLLPVIPDPDKVICAGVNYRAHAEETGRAIPTRPSMFLRMASTLLADGEAMRRPRNSTAFDFEGELAVIIGKQGRMIDASDALGHVAGYCCFVDGSVRDYQKFSVTSGKNFNATGPLGPWMVTADEIADPASLMLTTRLNGTVMQQSGVDRICVGIHDTFARRCDCDRHT